MTTLWMQLVVLGLVTAGVVLLTPARRRPRPNRRRHRLARLLMISPTLWRGPRRLRCTAHRDCLPGEWLG